MENHKIPTHHGVTTKSTTFNIKIRHKTHNSQKAITTTKQNQNQAQKTSNSEELELIHQLQNYKSEGKTQNDSNETKRERIVERNQSNLTC